MTEGSPDPAADLGAGRSRAECRRAGARVDSARGSGCARGRIPRPLLIVVALGVLLRVAVWAAVSPVSVNLLDGAVYVAMADGDLFSDPVRPVGFSLFLRGAHLISDQIWWTMLLQNLLGVATACLLYATVRRIGAPVWCGVCAAAAVMLSLDQAYLEHSFLAEPLFTLLVVIGVYAAVRALGQPSKLAGGRDPQVAWLLAAGLAVGLAAWVRTAGLALLPLLVIWATLAIPGSLAARVTRGALLGSVGVVCLLAYFALNEAATDSFSLTRGQGRVLYGRAAQFADCSKFEPPKGTEILCDQTPPAQRFGPDFYMWDARAVAPQNFAFSADDDAKLGAFARAAIFAQPLAYLEAASKDMLRFFLPGYNDERPFGGGPAEFMRFDHRDAQEQATLETIRAYYADESQVLRGFAGTLSDLQAWLRVSELWMLAALLLSACGLVLARRSLRSGLALLAACGLGLLATPALVISYNARYAVPAAPLMIAAGAIGLWLVSAELSGLRRRHRRPSPAG